MIKRHADDVTIDYIIRLRKLEQENERLREKYEEAISDIAEWGAYAPEFFQNKHDLEGCIEKHRAALKETE